jgi:hypothetical protein
MIDLANQYNQYVDRCRYHVNDSTRLKHFETDTFDFVYSIIVLQHMEAPYIEAYLAEFIRVLNPGGLAVVQIPAEVNPCRNGAAGRESAAALPGAAFRAEVDACGVPAALTAGSQVLLNARVKNVSGLSWPVRGTRNGDYRLKLGSHWLDESGAAVKEFDGLTNLPSDLGPNEECKVPLLITAPKEPGRYQLVIDVLQQGVAWFQHKGSRAWVRQVDAQEPDGNAVAQITDAVTAIQMFGIPRQRVVRVVEEAGGRVLDAREDRMAGEEWLSYTYYFTKDPKLASSCRADRAGAKFARSGTERG